MGTAFPGIAKTLCVSLLLSLPAMAAEPSPTRESLIGQRVAEMIQVGFARGPRAIDEAQRLYESLRSDTSNNPRIDYAHGLVLLRLMRSKEAQAGFLVATKRPGAPYWPAWEALIWTHFVAKNYEVGYERLLEFAKLVQNSSELTDDAREEEIHWIGRVMAALELTLDSNQNRETWLQTEKKLTVVLREESTEDYISGKKDVNSRHVQLEEEIRQTREKAKERQNAQLDKKQERISKSLDAVKEKRENLKKSAAEMKESLAEQKAAYDKQMARLEKDYGFAERRAAMLISSMATLDQEVFILQQRRRNQNSSPADSQRLDQTILQIQNQRSIYGAEFQRSSIAAEQISANAQKLNEERADLVDQYQKATGDLVQEDAGIEKWKERTLKQANLLKKAEATAKPPNPAGKIQAARTFRTYIDLDLYAERNRVLDSFGVTFDGK